MVRSSPVAKGGGLDHKAKRGGGMTVRSARAFGDASVKVNRQTKSLRFLFTLILCYAEFGEHKRHLKWMNYEKNSLYAPIVATVLRSGASSHRLWLLGGGNHCYQ